MHPYDRLSALLDDPGNRHGPDRACVLVSVAGGRKRYVWIDRTTVLTVTLFGHRIAELLPCGDVRVTCAGYFTQTTREALSWVLTGHRHAATLRTPGSRGRWTNEPDQMTLYLAPGAAVVLTDGDEDPWRTISNETFVNRERFHSQGVKA